ncbi:MAG: glycoside hydrolase [Chloroflexota bacterium]
MSPGLPEVWAGVESSYLRIRNRRRDQLAETGHADRPDDLDRLASLGVRAVRYPILWGRGPVRHGTDWTWAGARLGRLLQLGIDPVVELLHHGFGPGHLHPLDPDWPAAFGRFAGRVARRFPDVRWWLPINEPLTTARFSGLYAWWWPHSADHPTFVRLLLAQVLGWRAAARAIRRVRPDARLIVNEDVGRTWGTPRVALAAAHDAARRWLTFDLLTGRVDRAHPLWEGMVAVPGAAAVLEELVRDPEPPDVLGLDYYLTSDRFLDHRADAYPEELRGGGHGLRYADAEAVRVAGEGLAGWDRIIDDAWRRYRMPLALTEVQLTGELDDQVAWWREAWDAAVAACAAGADVRAVTAWSVFGSWDWDSLLRRRGRTFAPGPLSPEPEAAGPLADAIRAAARHGDPGPAPTGWWRRPDRVRYHPSVLWRSAEDGPEAVTDLPSELVAAAP